MFAIAFDLVVAEAQTHHPKGVSQAYSDIRTTLSGHGFDWVQGSLYTSKDEDLAKLFSAYGSEGAELVPAIGTRHQSLPCRAMVGFPRLDQELGSARAISADRLAYFLPIDESRRSLALCRLSKEDRGRQIDSPRWAQPT